MNRAAYPQTASMNLRQAMLVSATLVLSRYSSFLPQAAARAGGSSGWMLVLFTCLPLAAGAGLLYLLLRGSRDLRLDRAMRQNLPPFVYRLFMGVYAAAGVMYCALYLRLYVSKLSVMIFFESSPYAFSAALLAVVGLILTARPVILARMNDPVCLFMVAVLWILSLLMLPEANFSEWVPITPADIGRSASQGILLGGVWLYSLLPFLSGDAVVIIDRPVKSTVLFLLGIFATVFFVTFTVLSQLGPDLASSLYLPLLFALRNSSLSLLERSEVLLVTLWVLGDAMFICIMARMALHTAGQALGTGFQKRMIPLALILIFAVSLAFGSDTNAIQLQAETVFIPANLLFGLGLPALSLGIGRIRERLRKRSALRRRERVRAES